MIIITDEIVEAASIAEYEQSRKLAPKYYAGTQLERFIPWEEISDDWRNDYRACTRAGLEAAALFMVHQ